VIVLAVHAWAIQAVFGCIIHMSMSKYGFGCKAIRVLCIIVLGAHLFLTQKHTTHFDVAGRKLWSTSVFINCHFTSCSYHAARVEIICIKEVIFTMVVFASDYHYKMTVVNENRKDYGSLSTFLWFGDRILLSSMA
jgi:hypothetical protein